MLLSFLRLLLWSNIWSVLESVPCVLKKNVYFTGSQIECSIYVRFIWSVVLFKFTVSLLILFLDDISLVESGVLKFPAILLLFISPFSSVSFCFMYLGAQYS